MKASRDGLRIIDLYQDFFEQKLRLLAEGYRKRYGPLLKYSVEDEIQKFKVYKDQLRPYVVDAVEYMKVTREKRRSVLVESSQALLLDVDFGSYPFCTSSSCSLSLLHIEQLLHRVISSSFYNIVTQALILFSGCISGLALNPFDIQDIIGISKSYTTRVGGGPFPTEQVGDVGKILQEIGREFVSYWRRSFNGLAFR